MNIKDRLKHRIRFLDGNPGWRNNGNRAFDTPVDNKIFTGELTDKLDEYFDLHFIEINRNKTVRRHIGR